MVPSFDFFLFSLLAGLTLGLAFVLDSPALVFLAALLAPFMAPALGISLGTITGVVRFVFMSAGSLGIGSLIVFLCGLLAGWAVQILPVQAHQQVIYHSQFHWAYLFVLVLGALLTHYLIVRSPNQRPLVTSVAVAYGLYAPVGAAGFGITSGIGGLWPNGLGLFLVHLLAVIISGVIMLAFLKIRPLNAAGYALSAVYVLGGLALLVVLVLPRVLAPAPQPAQVVSTATPVPGVAGVDVLQPTLTASPSLTPSRVASATPALATSTPTPTRTLVPSKTVTLTITAQPTPVWARINAEEGNGAIIREEPNYDGKVIQALLNGTLVEVLPDQVLEVKGTAWVKVRTVDGKEGWIVRLLLRTATPAPGW
jgi:hypothetical protein